MHLYTHYFLIIYHIIRYQIEIPVVIISANTAYPESETLGPTFAKHPQIKFLVSSCFALNYTYMYKRIH